MGKTELKSQGKTAAIPYVAAFIFFFCLWWLDFPKPWGDDLFFCGSALNLAQGESFSNPFIAWLPGQMFFYQPPVHFYAMAGWLKVFGVSAGSLTGYQMAMYFFSAAGIIAILQHHGGPVWLMFLAPLAVFAALGSFGFRMESLAAALMLGGFALLERDDKVKRFSLLAFSMIFLGTATAPRTSLFGIALFLLAAHRLWKTAPLAQQRSKLFISATTAFILVSLTLLVMIHFRVQEFWRIFSSTAKVVIVEQSKLNGYYANHFTGIQIFLLALGVGMFAVVFQYRQERLVQICIVMSLMFSVAFYFRLLEWGVGRFFALCLLLLLSAVAYNKIPRLASQAWLAGLTTLLIWLNGSTFAHAYGIITGKIHSGPFQQYAVARQQAVDQPEHTLLDAEVARYTFGYRLPKGSRDFWFSRPFPLVGGDIAQQPSGCVYLFGSQNRDSLIQGHYLDEPLSPRWYCLKWSFYESPQQVYIIQSQDLRIAK